MNNLKEMNANRVMTMVSFRCFQDLKAKMLEAADAERLNLSEWMALQLFECTKKGKLRIEKLENDNTKISNELDKAMSEIQKLETSLSTINNENESATLAINDSKDKLQSQKNECSLLKKQLLKLEKTITKLQKQMKSITNRLNNANRYAKEKGVGLDLLGLGKLKQW